MSRRQSNIVILNITPNLSIKFNSKSVVKKEKVCGITIYQFSNSFAIATNGKISFPIVAKNPYLV